MIHRVGAEVDALDDRGIQRHRLVQLDVVREGELIRRVQQPVVVDHRGRLCHGSLEIGARLDRQNVDRQLRAERHGSSPHFEISCQLFRLGRTALVLNRDESLRGRRGGQRDTQQLQELGAVALGQQVGPVQQRLGEKREQLNQRDAGISLSKVRPFGRVHAGASQRLLDQLPEAAVVDDGGGERHRSYQVVESGTLRLMRSRAAVATSR